MVPGPCFLLLAGSRAYGLLKHFVVPMPHKRFCAFARCKQDSVGNGATHRGQPGRAEVGKHVLQQFRPKRQGRR